MGICIGGEKKGVVRGMMRGGKDNEGCEYEVK
jgi:hypothetical protein